MAALVKCDTFTTGGLVLDFQHHESMILIVELIVCINEEETPVLIMGMLFPQKTHVVYAYPNPRMQPPAQMLDFTNLLRLWPRHRQEELCHHLSPRLPDYDGSDTGVIVQTNQSLFHKRPILHPRWMVMCV